MVGLVVNAFALKKRSKK